MRRFFDYDFDGLSLSKDSSPIESVSAQTLNAFVLPSIFAAPNPDLPLFADIDGDESDNTLTGTSGADTINGFGGNDTISGLDGDDTINGGVGDDVILPGLGTDTIDGGDGFDLISYEGVTVGLTSFIFSAIFTVGGTGISDTISNSEGLVGGSGDDNFFVIDNEATKNMSFYFDGGAGNDFLRLSSSGPGLGNNQFFGGDGDDFMKGGAGVDSYDGGAGIDRVSYFFLNFNVARQSLHVDLRINEITNDGFGNTETIVGVENISGGSYLADTFHGDANDNVLFGNVGGADSLFGHEGNDELFLAEAGGTIDGGSGNDTLQLFGTRFLNEDLDLNLQYDEDIATQGVDINLSTGLILNDGFDGTGSVVNVENLIGTALDDILTGNNDATILTGDAGNDILAGGGGDDSLIGGEGFDTARFSGTSFNDYTITDNGNGNFTVIHNSGGVDGTDTLQSIEFIEINGTIVSLGPINLTEMDDIYTGNGADEIINGLGGEDTIHGAGGNDTINGGEGEDTISGGEGNDILDGGAGQDRLSFVSAISNVNISISELSGTNSATTDLETDTFTNFERFLLSEYDDTITIAATVMEDVRISGNGGNDTVFGGNGYDRFEGQDGDDSFTGNSGYDEFFGGDGIDTLNYSNPQSDYRIIFEGGSTISITHINDGADNVDLGINVETAQFSDSSVNIDINDLLITGVQVTGTAAMDFIVGVEGADAQLNGAAGNDTIFGNSFFDWIDGGDGDDNINYGFGYDTVFGGTGNDYVLAPLVTEIFALDDGTVVLNAVGNGVAILDGIEYIRPGSDDGLNVFSGSESPLSNGNDVFSGTDISDLINGALGDDTIEGLGGNDNIIGGSGDDTLSGGAGFDQLIGGYGDDVLNGGGNNDYINGGSGIDTVIFSGNQAEYTITASRGGWIISHMNETGVDGRDFVRATEFAQFADGTIALDPGTGTQFTDLAGTTDIGGGTLGDDVLDGLFGEDVIFGLAGNDVIYGGFGRDTLYGGDGDDQLYGGVDPDILFGGDGDDVLHGGGDSERLYGGGGVDTAVYSATRAAAIITENPDGSFNVFSDLLVDIEFIQFSDETISLGSAINGTSGNDSALNGTADADVINGFAGNDVINGLAGDDVINGGDGADRLIGGLGADALNGDAGFDSADYRGATEAVRFNPVTGGTAGEALGDTFSGIERYYLSNFNDVITGTDANEFFYGEDGNDQINGGGGIDRIYGGEGNDIQRGQDGNDTLYGSAGADQLNGGVGFDIANYTLASAAVVVNMLSSGTGGDAAGDTYFGIEAVYGSDFDDSLTGNNSVNELRGGDGNDALFGLGGNDRFFGGAGADSFDGGAGTDIVNYTLAVTGITIDLTSGGTTGEANGDTFTSIEWVFGSDFDDSITGDAANNRLEGRDGNDALNGEGGNDRLLGGEGNDTINGGDGVDTIFGQNGDDIMTGGAGNDFFFGGTGADSHDGGTGTDTVSYLASNSGVTVNMLSFGTASTGDAAGDSFTSIERIFGSGHDDNLLGNTDNNTLIGNGGNDYLAGGSGNDSLNGGAGIDSFGYDEVVDGADVITGFTLNETVFIFGGTVTDFASLQALGSDAGANVIFDFGGGNTLTIVGRNLADLDASNFDFSGTPPAGQPLSDPDAFSADVVDMFDMDALI